MERMKRLRAAQLNRTFQGQVLSATQKRAVEERERLARAQLERAARLREGSPPRRARSPEYSPPRLSASPRPCHRPPLVPPLLARALQQGRPPEPLGSVRRWAYPRGSPRLSLRRQCPRLRRRPACRSLPAVPCPTGLHSLMLAASWGAALFAVVAAWPATASACMC